jgi:hypothetical protein
MKNIRPIEMMRPQRLIEDYFNLTLPSKDNKQLPRMRAKMAT